MSPFSFLRTAVKLLLIVALAIQPVTAHATVGECGTTGSTWQGCGCGEMEKASDSCGCSGGRDEPTREHGGCVHESSERAVAEGSMRTKASDDHRLALAVGPGKAASATPPNVLRSCSCEQQPQPLGDAPSQRRSSESRQSIAVAYAAFDASSRGSVPANGAERRNADLPTPQHASQVLLCIWRL